MFSSPFLCLSFLGVTIFNQLQWINANRNGTYSGGSTNDPNFGPVPPRPGEAGSQVPPNWKWQSVSVDDICGDNPYIRDQAQRLFQQNTLYSILYGQETQTRHEYDARVREYRNKFNTTNI
ncbi:unnamed protein product [Rotaria sp. Silwood1]|nr:unnamed protein product [Rotaria sp. Silwood1]CAF5153977.1 unnamed protein product [Rotaria sp. Silwood1]